MPVFRVLKRGGHVYVEFVKNCSKESLLPMIQGKILEGATLYTGGCRAYNVLLSTGMTVTVSIIVKTNLRVGKIMSTVSRLLGLSQKEDSQNLIDCKITCSFCISKNANLGSIIGIRTF